MYPHSTHPTTLTTIPRPHTQHEEILCTHIGVFRSFLTTISYTKYFYNAFNIFSLLYVQWKNTMAAAYRTVMLFADFVYRISNIYHCFFQSRINELVVKLI